MRADPSFIARTRALIGASDPQWLQIGVHTEGRQVIRQEGREAHVTGREVVAWQSSLPYTIDARTPFDCLVLYCPTSLLRPHVDRIAAQTAKAFDGGAGPGLLVRQFVIGLHGELTQGSVRGREAQLGECALDLVRTLFVAQEERGGHRSAALRRRIRAYVDDHLGDPLLGAPLIAREHYVSRRYVDRLFEADGTSVREHIRRRRLERCRRDLLDPTLAHESIAVIAMRWGFVSASHFSRAFRAAYGQSPSEVRRA